MQNLLIQTSTSIYYFIYYVFYIHILKLWRENAIKLITAARKSLLWSSYQTISIFTKPNLDHHICWSKFCKSCMGRGSLSITSVIWMPQCTHVRFFHDWDEWRGSFRWSCRAQYFSYLFYLTRDLVGLWAEKKTSRSILHLKGTLLLLFSMFYFLSLFMV